MNAETPLKSTENITIAIVGFPNAGKSTIVNSLTCNNYSKINTEHETIFRVGDFENKNYNDEQLNALIQNGETIDLKIPEDYHLDTLFNYTFVDIVGVEKESNVHLDTSMKKIKKSDMLFDMFIVVFDVNKLEEDIVKNKKLLKTVSDLSLRNFNAKIMIVLNKCDSILYGKSQTVIQSEVEDNMIKIANSQFCYYKCDILPLCAKKSHIFSAGIYGNFSGTAMHENYSAEAEYANPRDLLRKHGFSEFANKINEYVNESRTDIINSHVNHDLNGTINDIDELLIMIRRLRTNKLNDICEPYSNTLLMFEKKTLNYACDNMTLDNVEQFTDKLNKIKKMYETNFNVTFDADNKFSSKMKIISVQKFFHELDIEFNVSTFKKIYDVGEVSPSFLYDTMCKHIKHINLCDTIKNISEITNHDPDYLYSVIHAYVMNNVSLYLIFKNSNIDDPYLNFIKMKLSQENIVVPPLNFKETTSATETFKKITLLFDELYNDTRIQDSASDNNLVATSNA
jgi:GTPase SAR1 family protein